MKKMILVCCLAISCLNAEVTPDIPIGANFINQWLVLGPLGGDVAKRAFYEDLIQEKTVTPRLGQATSGRSWEYFDDRIFSRNYDDYQDLRSFYLIKKKVKAEGIVAYAHVYLFSKGSGSAELRCGADRMMQAFLNGEKVSLDQSSSLARDGIKGKIELKEGWNRLLIKVSQKGRGGLGFYARISDEGGKEVPDLIYSVNGPGSLEISTQKLNIGSEQVLPVAWREWPYGAADAWTVLNEGAEEYQNSKSFFDAAAVMRASGFYLNASGGQPPYRWMLQKGSLPKGLTLAENGLIGGVVAVENACAEFLIAVKVQDASGAVKEKQITLTVKERPNRRTEQQRLIGLISCPETMPEGMHEPFIQVMSRIGYGSGLPVSGFNGNDITLWPSKMWPHSPDYLEAYRAPLAKNKIEFGLYIGAPSYGYPHCRWTDAESRDAFLLVMEETILRFKPKIIYCDWAGLPMVPLDSIYSMVRSIDPELVIIKNGIPTMAMGDWDIICMERIGMIGEKFWDKKPYGVNWPKKVSVESWSHMADPINAQSMGESKNDPHEYMQLILSTIGEGIISDFDFSPTWGSGLYRDGKKAGPGETRPTYVSKPEELLMTYRLKTMDDSPYWVCLQQMADWASPKGLPRRTESYTNVDLGPYRKAPWGYSMMSLDGSVLYLHLIKNGWGKEGVPASKKIEIPLDVKRVKKVTCLNQGQEVIAKSLGVGRLEFDLKSIEVDPVSTILKIELNTPGGIPVQVLGKDNGNLVLDKPCKLLSLDGERILPPSAMMVARYGNDGVLSSVAVGANEWGWMYEVDLEKVESISRFAIDFSKEHFATEFEVLISEEHKTWKTVHQAKENKSLQINFTIPSAKARYLRIRGLKPDGPDQVGSQMGIAELQVFR